MTIHARGRTTIRQLDPVRLRASAGSETLASRLIALVPIAVLALALALALGIAQAGALDETQPGAVATLVKAYPDFLDRVDGNDVVWKDGTRQRIDDGKAAKSFEAMLDDPDIKDMFALTYPIAHHAVEQTFD